MGLFRPYERSAESKQADGGEATPKQQVPTPGKKQGATPTRREAEAARRERLHPTLSPAEQRRRDRTVKAREREAQWSKVDEQPARALLRDFLDSRRGLAQWWMPVIISTLALALVLMYVDSTVAVWATFVPYVALAALAVHIFILWRQFKALCAERLPNEPLRGLLMYLINRIISLRRFRMPAPRVSPGDQI